MTIDGRIVFTYEDDNLKRPDGMYCDSEDNLFVSGRRSNAVQAIAADDKICGTLLTSSDGLKRPQCIAYLSPDDALNIGCNRLNRLLVYKMKK